MRHRFEEIRRRIALGAWHPAAVVALERRVGDAGLLLDPRDWFERQDGRDVRVLARVDAARADADGPEAGVPMRQERARLECPPRRIHEDGGLWRNAQRLNRTEDAHGLGQELDRALRVLGLRGAVLVEVARPLDLEHPSREVDVGPAEPCGLGRPHPSPEQHMHEGVEVRVWTETRTVFRGTWVEAEALLAEPDKDTLAFLCGEWIGARDLDAGPDNSLEGVVGNHVVDDSRIAEHRLQATGEDVLRVLHREAALAELGAQAQDVARRDLAQWQVAERGEHVAFEVTAVVDRLGSPHLTGNLVGDPALEVRAHGRIHRIERLPLARFGSAYALAENRARVFAGRDRGAHEAHERLKIVAVLRDVRKAGPHGIVPTVPTEPEPQHSTARLKRAADVVSASPLRH